MLARQVKLRDHQRLAHGPLTGIPPFREGFRSGSAVPGAVNTIPARSAGRILSCRGLGSDRNAYILLHHPGTGRKKTLRRDRRARMEDPSRVLQPPAREAPQRDLRRDETYQTSPISSDGTFSQDVLPPCGPILCDKDLSEVIRWLRATVHRGRSRPPPQPRTISRVGQSDQDGSPPPDMSHLVERSSRVM